MKRFPVLILLFLLTACLPASAPPPTLDVAALSTAAVSTIEAGWTATALAAVTPTPSLTPTPPATSTPSLTPTPPSDFSQAKIVALSWIRTVALQIAIDIPRLHLDGGSYRGRVEQYEYPCERRPEYPDRLYCIGRGFRPGTLWTFDLLPVGSETVLYTKKITIPEIPIPGDLRKYLAGNCEVEPLYQPFRPEPAWNNPANDGCYAITCVRWDGSTCGTRNTCWNMPPEPCP